MALPFPPLEDWTFQELVQFNQSSILMAIPVGDFNQAVFNACDLALRWKSLQAQKASAK